MAVGWLRRNGKRLIGRNGERLTGQNGEQLAAANAAGARYPKKYRNPQLLGSFLSGNFCFTVCAFFFGDGKSGWDAAALGLARAEGAELGGKSGCGAAGRVSGTVAEGAEVSRLSVRNVFSFRVLREHNIRQPHV